MITPLSTRDELDVAGLERLIERILAGGVNGLFILGTTGEAPSLSYRLRRELIQRVCRQVNHRVPVLVGITDTAIVESVNLARYAAEAGADCLVAAPPYYFPAGQPEVTEYMEHLAADLPLPLFLYNMPQMTKLVFEPDTVRRLLHVEGVIGMKDSSGDPDYFRTLVEIRRNRPEWSLLIGQEQLLIRAVEIGANGGVTGGANLDPRLFVEAFEAACAHDDLKAHGLQRRIVELSRIYQIGRHASSVIKGTKCALSLLGVCNDFVAEPFCPFREEERAQISQILAGLELSPDISPKTAAAQ